MNLLISALTRFGILKDDLDQHFLRASMVIIFLFFGYQKWFQYEAEAWIPYISNGPLIFWMYPVFGVRGATYFLGVAEWLFAAGLLVRKIGNSRSSRFVLFVPRDLHDHPVHARWLGGFRVDFPL